MGSNKSDFAEDLLSDLPQHIAPPHAADFQPWHKVRKQYIREKQWNAIISRTILYYLKRELQNDAEIHSSPNDGDFLTETQLTNVSIDRPLQCLIIPGDDLLDMRSLWKHIRPKGYFLRYLGFNERHGSDQPNTRIHIANTAVTSLDGVATDSRVIADRFQLIAREKTKAYHYLKEHGPFHLVNLDMCDSLFPVTSSSLSEHVAALCNLIEFQVRHLNIPWLLFITTRVDPNAVNIEELQLFCKPVRQNHDNYPEFAQVLDRLVPREAFQIQDSSIEISGLSEEALIHLFGVAMGKFLLSVTNSGDRKWKIKMLESHRYKIREKPSKVEMLSLAFSFHPTLPRLVDPTNLANREPHPQTPFNELECARNLVTAVERISDVDELLQKDAFLRAEMETSSADLLEEAGYDRDEYLKWPLKYFGEFDE